MALCPLFVPAYYQHDCIIFALCSSSFVCCSRPIIEAAFGSESSLEVCLSVCVCVGRAWRDSNADASLIEISRQLAGDQSGKFANK